jgi:drug/metabolite transporter (DMT)-like permease
LAAGYALTKRFVLEYPPRQLIGPLYALNAIVLLPLAPFAAWRFSPRIGLLLLASVATMAITAALVFELLTHASAATVATGQALSPLPAVVFAALLLPGRVGALHAALAVLVALAVLASLGDVYGVMSSRRGLLAAAAAAAGAGLIVVLTKLLTNEGAGLAEIYVLRTAAAASIWLLLAPPRAVPPRALPAMSLRAGLISLYFALVILAVERGSPVTVQTLVATAPLMLLLGTLAVRGERPPARVALAAVAASAGVLVVLVT